MAYDNNKLDLSILYKVLPEYFVIGEGDKDGAKDVPYKAIDSRTGDIFLIQHPKFWASETRLDGSFWKIRPKPKFMMSYEQARDQTRPKGKSRAKSE